MARMAMRLKARLAGIEQRFHGIEVMAESLVWICGWLVIPVHLARSGVGVSGFAAYVFGAGLLVSLGVLATNRESFGVWDRFVVHLFRCWLALLFAGGIVFLISARLSQATHI